MTQKNLHREEEKACKPSLGTMYLLFRILGSPDSVVFLVDMAARLSFALFFYLKALLIYGGYLNCWNFCAWDKLLIPNVIQFKRWRYTSCRTGK